MKQLVILSGKGGTGKTTVAASFIALAQNKAFADCDVDAPNLHLIHAKGLNPIQEDFYGYQKAVKHEEYCIACGICEDLCQFGAIRNGKVNQYECEGCGVCEAVCPSQRADGRKAIALEKNISGKTLLYINNESVFSSAELKMGNGASGKLVTQVRKNLYQSMRGQEIVIIDGSPGIGCPVIASVTGADLVLVVAEPTVSGMHDMERIAETAGKFDATCVMCINKFDVNLVNALKIEKYCGQQNILMAGRIPFDPQVIEAANTGKPVVLFANSPAKDAIVSIWKTVSALLLKK